MSCSHSPACCWDAICADRRNYSFYWDDKYGSSYPAKPPCSLLVLTAHAVYQAVLYAAVYLLVTRPLPALIAYVMVYLLVPASAASAMAEALRLPDITRRLFGRLMDAYRSDNYITYAAPGAPGSLEAALTSSTATATVAATARHGASWDDATAQADRTEGAQHDPVHIFAVQPAGVISRSAFWGGEMLHVDTFATHQWHCLPGWHRLKP
jgi:hypothetical protein